MNSGDEGVDPKVIEEIVEKVVAKLDRRGQQRDDGYSKSTRHIVRREIHGEIHLASDIHPTTFYNQEDKNPRFM